jgi:hypothetical protein
MIRPRSIFPDLEKIISREKPARLRVRRGFYLQEGPVTLLPCLSLHDLSADLLDQAVEYLAERSLAARLNVAGMAEVYVVMVKDLDGLMSLGAVEQSIKEIRQHALIQARYPLPQFASCVHPYSLSGLSGHCPGFFCFPGQTFLKRFQVFINFVRAVRDNLNSQGDF